MGSSPDRPARAARGADTPGKSTGRALLPFSPIDLAKLDPAEQNRVLDLVREVERHNAEYDRRAQLFGTLFAVFIVIVSVVFVLLGHPYFAIATLVTEALGFATKIVQQRR